MRTKANFGEKEEKKLSEMSYRCNKILRLHNFNKEITGIAIDSLPSGEENWL